MPHTESAGAGCAGAGRLLILRPGAIGDTLLTLPALLMLRRRFPGWTLEMAGNSAALPLVAAAGVVDSWLSFDDPRITPLFVPGPPAPTDPFRGVSVAVAWCADPDGSLAYGLRARGASAVVVAPSRPSQDAPKHVARHLLRTVLPLVSAGYSGDMPTPELPSFNLPAWATEQADATLATAGVVGPGRSHFLVVQPGSGSPGKNWPADRFAEVVMSVQAQVGLPTLVLGGPADADALDRLRRSVPDSNLLAILTDLPLLVVAAILRRAQAYLGNDSGLAHLAGQFGVPTLVLFGPTDPVVWQPLGPRVRVLRAQPLAELAVQAVLAALRPLLAPGI